MAQTPLSAASPGYAAPADLLAYADARTIGDWISDNGTRVDVSAFATNAYLLAALAGASGEVEAAVCADARYVPADLQALTGSAKQLLKKLVCGRALDDIYGRRQRSDKKPQVIEWAEKMLDDVRNGRRIFPTVEAEAAGLTIDYVETYQDKVNRGGITVAARRFFGTRADELRPPFAT